MKIKDRFGFADCFSYCPHTGKINLDENSLKRRGVTASIRKTSNKSGNTEYFQIRAGSDYVYGHRLAWRIHFGQWPTGVIDHIDGDGLNNRIENLRDCSMEENMRNKRIYKKNKTGISGVYKEKGRNAWTVSINGERICREPDFFEAVCIRMSALNKQALYTDRHGR